VRLGEGEVAVSYSAWTVGSVEYAQERGQGYWQWREARHLARRPRGAGPEVDSNTERARVEVVDVRGYRQTLVKSLQTEKARAWRERGAAEWANGLEGRMRALLEAEVAVPRRHAVRSWDNGAEVGEVEAQEWAAWRRGYLCARWG